MVVEDDEESVGWGGKTGGKADTACVAAAGRCSSCRTCDSKGRGLSPVGVLGGVCAMGTLTKREQSDSSRLVERRGDVTVEP